MLDEPDFQLTWPKPLFEAEARAVLRRADADRATVEMELLLTEAFAGPAVVDRFRAGSSSTVGYDPFGPDLDTATGPAFFQALVDAVDRLTEPTLRTPYFTQRKSGAGREPLSMPATKEQFARLVGDFFAAGYLDKEMPGDCVDDRERGVDPAWVLEDRLGRTGLWPLQPEGWDDDTFFDLVEVFHDLVARPRRRWYHDFSRCGWHYSDYALAPARRLYRWRVNTLLDRSVVGYRLAEGGDDQGRLVAAVDDARGDLLAAMVERDDPDSAGKVRHAVALFRARAATVEERRSAVRVLADVLESRRGLLTDELVSKDEEALFTIANGFAVRHHRADQHGDYDPVFLDWMFWWYLATVELTDRILARPARP